MEEISGINIVKEPEENTEVVRRMTLAMRVADKSFQSVGGSTRHHVRDCLLPILAEHGLVIGLIEKPDAEE